LLRRQPVRGVLGRCPIVVDPLAIGLAEVERRIGERGIDRLVTDMRQNVETITLI
jgi:hypothetical protein